MAVADAHLTRATCLARRGDVQDAIDHLVRENFRMQDYATQAAVNLLKGRLVELRQTAESDDFDRHFEAAIAREVAAQAD